MLFVYNRPWHTQQTIDSLRKNELASCSELFIYSDNAKDTESRKGVDKVRKYIENIEGFKSVTVIKRDKNMGLANSIIEGVTEVLEGYDKVIVLEDDLITSPHFLRFMNSALEFYKTEKNVWHISGWNYPIQYGELEDVFLWRVMNCWGWATWNDRWKYFERNTQKIIHDFSKDDIKKFNLDGVENFFGQVLANRDKTVNTWSVYWYAIIFLKNGLCLNPTQSYVENIGHDDSGVNCDNTDCFSSGTLSDNEYNNFPVIIKENIVAVNMIKDFCRNKKGSLLVRVVNKLSAVMSRVNLLNLICYLKSR